jgi:thiamine-monophosphate kinase
MCDVSDGLLSELNHIATSSKVGIEVDVKSLEAISGFAELSAAAGLDIWKIVLTGGEDHIFVATTSAEIPLGAFTIGRVVAGSEVKVPGLENFPTQGFRHF